MNIVIPPPTLERPVGHAAPLVDPFARPITYLRVSVTDRCDLQDEFGNRYFRTRNGKIDPTLGFERRWVIYNGLAETTAVRRPRVSPSPMPARRSLHLPT